MEIDSYPTESKWFGSRATKHKGVMFGDYQSFGRCESCYREMQISNKEMNSRLICKSCQKYHPKSGQCWTCDITFSSRNELFRHLRQNNHMQNNTGVNEMTQLFQNMGLNPQLYF